MFQNANTTREQGDIGLSAAIFHLTKEGYTVSLPLTDNSSYDMLVEKQGDIYRVQVKSTKQISPSGNYVVSVGRVRPNRSENKIHKFNKNESDYLFVATEHECYFIPSDAINVGRELTINDSYKEYIV